MAYAVIWSPRAVADVEALANYLATIQVNVDCLTVTNRKTYFHSVFAKKVLGNFG